MRRVDMPMRIVRCARDVRKVRVGAGAANAAGDPSALHSAAVARVGCATRTRCCFAHHTILC